MIGAASPVVVTTRGAVRGTSASGVARFRGIPFAEAPVGPLRFAAPARRTPWAGEHDATAHGATPQRRPFGEFTTVPEPSIPGDDTLLLSITTPSPVGPDAALPVFVWIHGGGFYAGSPASPWYDGVAFARDGVVTVVVSYRLGFDGFGLVEGAPANRALLDVIAALEWVRDEIRAFGGDPDRVTIGGQSAGGAMTLALCASPAAAGLFQGAISQSGPVVAVSRADAAAAHDRLAAALGVDGSLETWRTVDEQALLDAQPAANAMPDRLAPDATLDEAIAAVRTGAPSVVGNAFAPVCDGDVLPASPVDAIRAGRAADVPLVLGTTAEEFGVARPVLNAAAFRSAVTRVGAARIAAGLGARTFAYDHAFRPAHTGAAVHCAELPFVWDLLDAPGVAPVLGETPPQALADAAHGAWVRFIRSGDPGWPSLAEATAGAMVFDAVSAHDPDRYAPELVFTEEPA